MDEFDYKTCPECSERIPHLAKKCPFCKSFLTKKLWQNPPVLLAVLVPFLFVGLFFSMSWKTNHKPIYLFADFVQKVPVTSSEPYFEATKIGRTVTVIGTIRNDTDIPWEHPSMEAQFYDKTGKLIDVVESFYSGMTLLPHQEQAFRISGNASRALSEYATHQVLIRHASDAYHFSR